jgi:hypothetical protein
MRNSAVVNGANQLTFDIFLSDVPRKKHAAVFACNEKKK